MTKPEHTSKTPSPRTGIFALLAAFPRVKGSGAGGRALISQGTGASARRVLLPVLLVALGVLIFTTAPALAAEPAPEAPETTGVKSVTATSAVLEGVLNPHSTATAGWYFAYTTEAMCVPSLASPLEAEETVEAKHESVKVEGLEPNREYTFCMVATNEAGAQATQSVTALKFTTKPVPPAIEAESVSNVKAGEAHLEGSVNPNNQLTECHFQYAENVLTSYSKTELAEKTVPCEPLDLPDTFGGQGVGVTVGLNPDTTYHYRIVAKNGKGEESIEEKSFETALSPEIPEKLEAKPVAATTATLNGVLNPGSKRAKEPGTYEFFYKQSAGECELDEAERNQGLSQDTAPAPSPPGLEQNEPAAAEIKELIPGATYTFCLRATNEAGEEAISPPETFTTLAAAPEVVEEQASAVTDTEATLNAQIDPGGAETEYRFEYGTTKTYDKSTPPAKLEGSLTAAHTATVAIAGLKPNTTYHYRVLATNSKSPAGTPGEDMTFTTATAPTTTETCPNAQRRAEQPFAQTLPDCRAYEMVSPVEANGQDATDTKVETGPRAAISGEAVAYTSRGSFAGPSGANLESELISRRGPEGWRTQNITPLFDPKATEALSAYQTLAFTPELSEGLASANAALTSEAPAPGVAQSDLYLADLATGGYGYVGETYLPMGASTNLSRVVFGETGEILEWQDGTTVPVSVGNEGESLNASVGDAARKPAFSQFKDTWHAVSEDGSSVYFTSPASQENTSSHSVGGVRQLYVRVNLGQPQSPLKGSEAVGTGTLTEGAKVVSSLVAAAGTLVGNVVERQVGTTELAVEPTVGWFHVGQLVSLSGLEPGTEITKVTNTILPAGVPGVILTLSKPAIAELGEYSVVASEGPAPFVVGQGISGNGIQAGTTVEAVATGSLTLSKPAASSGGAVELRAGGGCSVAVDGCTVDVSASQRLLANAAGPQPARFWGASGDGSRVFFTSKAELTEDADTGPGAANLYEYDLNTKTLTDLTVPSTPAEKAEDPEGAAVVGVAQVSADGSYVYFVADGKLAEGATAGEPNLYVVHDGGAPALVATLTAGDKSDWTQAEPETKPGPAITTAAVSPGGGRLAFVSERSLTGYDNRQAHEGECEGTVVETGGFGTGNCREVYLYDAGSGSQPPGLVCVSCNPAGARPVGQSGLRPHAVTAIAEYRPRNVMEDGTVFFQSADALVTNASDGQLNVYEYEGGRVYALSDVAGGHESFFMDASADGRDVFFATADDLVPQDSEDNIVVYDARVDGGFPGPASACTTAEACRNASPPTPAVFGPPPSATFSGPGNFAPGGRAPNPVVKPKPKTLTRAQKLAAALKGCRKDKKKSRRAACEKQAKSKYGAKTKSRTSKKKGNH